MLFMQADLCCAAREGLRWKKKFNKGWSWGLKNTMLKLNQIWIDQIWSLIATAPFIFYLVFFNIPVGTSAPTSSRSTINMFVCERKLYARSWRRKSGAIILQFSHSLDIERANCKAAYIPDTVLSYKRQPHQGDGCRAHISSLLRSQNSENWVCEEAMQHEADSVSFMTIHYNLLSISMPRMPCNATVNYHLARFTNLMVALLLIT